MHSTTPHFLGAILSAPPKDPSTSGRNVRRDFVEGRIGNLIGVNLRRSLNNSPNNLKQFWIGIAGISVRVLFLIPQTDTDSLRSAWSNKGNFVLETFLFSKQRKCFVFDKSAKLRNTVRLQADRYTTSKHGNPLWLGVTKM